MGTHSYSPPRRSRTRQNSPFLKLPAEIRIAIYQYALIRDKPIDLWPHAYHTNSKPEEVESEGQELSREEDPYAYKVRHQEDLDYVRKEIATGLLGTCRQVYNEAAGYFWSDNHFRFSGRSGWQGLLRFFLTIGPEARARIRKIDVHAPIYMRWPVKDKDGKDLNGRSKNLPKMHMAKIPPEGHLDTVAKQRVCNILEQDRTLQEINFVVPASFRNGDENYFGGYDVDHEGTTDAIERIQQLDFVTMTVVFERDAYLAVEDGIQGILAEGWDLVCLPGSFIYEPGVGGEYEKHEVLQTRRWSAPCRQWDYMVGVSRLLADVEEDIPHANGGRHRRKTVKTARTLRGFGGCNFLLGADSLLVRLKDL